MTEDILSKKEKNAAELQKDIAGRHIVLNSYPPFVGLATDCRCNLKCVMCIQRLHDLKNLNDQEANPPIEEKYLIKFADQVFPTAKLVQLNTAGEPLMSARLDLELELAEKYRVKVELITNGILLNAVKGRFERIVRNASSIQFSFDSPFKDTYESIRKGSNFSMVIENMRLLHGLRAKLPVNRRPFVTIGMILLKRNVHEIQQMIRLAKELEIDHLNLANLIVHTKEMKSEVVDYRSKEVTDALDNAVKLAEALNVHMSVPPYAYKVSPSTSNPPKKTFHLCPFLWERVYIDAQANIFTCCEPTHPIAGSLKDSDFGQIWNNATYQAMRSTFLNGPAHPVCENCISSGYFDSCGF